jgi:predicted SAM-dependent methyltransferase
MNRKKCVFCGCSDFEEVFTLKNMPVFMGVNKGMNEYYSDMTFINCLNCKSVQILELVDPDLLYVDNHNLPIIGETWKGHYEEFIKFVKDYIVDSSVVEIGDPSFKLSSQLSNESIDWDIIELNPNYDIPLPNKTKIIKSYFDENLKIDKKIDIIIHSHFLEHVTDITKHIKTIHNLLDINGRVIFSIPNLEKILDLGNSPLNVLHFEHTYFYTAKKLINLFESEGFKMEGYREYKNHSIFFNFKKDEVVKTSERFKNRLIDFKKKVLDFNEIIKTNENSKIFIYGAHVSSQFLFNIGLNYEKILYILDNSKDKQEYKLYGSEILTKSPEIIEYYEKPIVIASHMSVYFEEIKNQLLLINPNTIII